MEPGLLIGGRFELERKIGQGSMSHVWLANDSGRKVAIKFAHDGGDGPMAFERAIARLASESQVLAKLDHPNVPSFVASSFDVPRPYVAMELIDGISLEQEIGRRARMHDGFELDDLARLIDEIASTLHYAHSLKVVHRDLKPANIMILDRAGRLYVKVLDFGVAKVLDQEDFRERTTVGRIVGTPLYLSPEQVFATGGVTPRVDVFALGVLAFEMLTLRRAWLRGEDHLPLASWRPPLPGARNAKDQVLHRITHGPRPSLSELRPELPEAVDQVLARALTVAPEERFPTTIELARALKRSLFSSRSRSKRSDTKRMKDPSA